MHEVDLLGPNGLGRRRGSVVKLDLTGLQAELGTNVAEIEIDGAIQTLNLVLDEQRHLDMAVFKELVQLLSNDSPLVGTEFLAHGFESRLSAQDELLGFCTFD